MKHEDTVLAGIAGYVDTLSFVALFGLFTAHVTGNFVLIGAATVGYVQVVFMKVLAFPAFVAGVVGTSLVARSGAATPQRTALRLYAMQAALMLAFCIAGVAASPVLHASDISVVFCGMLGVGTMGVQNARDRLISRPGKVPNTVMTGNVTQVALDAFELLSAASSPDARNTARERLKRSIPAVSAFACGAMAGATGFAKIGFWALLLPFVALLWLTFNASTRLQSAVGPMDAVDTSK